MKSADKVEDVTSLLINLFVGIYFQAVTLTSPHVGRQRQMALTLHVTFRAPGPATRPTLPGTNKKKIVKITFIQATIPTADDKECGLCALNILNETATKDELNLRRILVFTMRQY